MRIRGQRVALAFVVALVEASYAHGAGFQVSEQSIVGLGRAFAGAGVVGDDLSAAFYNPAGLMLLDGTQVQGGMTFVLPSAVFRGTSTRAPISLATGEVAGAPTVESGRGGGGGDTEVPHAYFVTDLLHERVRLGLAGTVPFGLITDYDSDWVGRYHGLRSIVRTLDVNPSFAVRVVDWLSVGGGMSAQYASVSLSQAVFTGTGQDGLAKVSGTDWSYGWNLGVLFEPTSRIRGGIGFRSKVKHTLDGELRVTGLGPTAKTDAVAATTFPQTLHGDLYFRVTDALGLSTGVRWTNWSRFRELRIRFDDPTMADAVTEERWHDTWMVKVGLDYAVLPGLVLRSGFAYDQTPVRGAEFRTPRIPDTSRYWLAAGLSYRPLDWMSLDVGYAHLFSRSARGDTTVPIAQPAPGTAIVDTLQGDFSGRADIVGASASVRF